MAKIYFVWKREDIYDENVNLVYHGKPELMAVAKTEEAGKQKLLELRNGYDFSRCNEFDVLDYGPETLIYSWMDTYEITGDKLYLEKIE